MLITIVLLLFMHWIADFVLQSDRIAINKSKNFEALLFHSFMYGIMFSSFGLFFIFIQFVTHLWIDYSTSRINSYLFANNKRHHFFNMIGFDQFLHISILITTYFYLIEGKS